MVFFRHGLTKPASTEPRGHAARSTADVCDAKWEFSVLLITYARKDCIDCIDFKLECMLHKGLGPRTNAF